jgi:hypothetical protein
MTDCKSAEKIEEILRSVIREKAQLKYSIIGVILETFSRI